MYYKFVLYQCQSCVTILYIITVITEIKIIAILVNNAFKTVQQSAKDKEDICRRADARQRYLTQDFTLWWTGLFAVIYGIAIISCFEKINLLSGISFIKLQSGVAHWLLQKINYFSLRCRKAHFSVIRW